MALILNIDTSTSVCSVALARDGKMIALKENNEKNKDEKEKRTGIVTKESIGAVGVLFSALAFLILVTRGLIFGDIGEAIASFLLGVFGDCAYPLLLVAFYISLTSFIGKRFIRSYSLGGRVLSEYSTYNKYDMKGYFLPEAAKEVYLN